MAKLSRTQRYAELRSQIANDSAQKMNTPQLNPYADRLNQMQEQANPSADQFNSFNQTPSQPVNDNYSNYDSFYNDNFNQPNIDQPQTFDSIVDSLENNQPDVSSFFNGFNPQETFNNSQPQEEAQFVQPEPVYEQPQDEIPFIQTEPVFEQPQETQFDQPEVVQQQYQQADFITPESINEQPEFVQPEPVYEQPQYVQPEPVQQPQTMPFEEAELVDEPYPTNKPNEFVDKLIDEVTLHNQNNGAESIDKITEDLAHNAIHNEEFEMDDEFSRTVTLEINKIMDQMTNTVNSQVIPEPVVETKPLEEKQPADFVNAYFENSKDAQQSMIEATSNIKKANTQEIEIMSLDELQKQEEISDTIPFVVNNNEVEEDEYYDEDDDDASNTVLNVILIVLILVLVAVLGLIVFYILKTKNIIG